MGHYYEEKSWPSHRWPKFTWEEFRCKHTSLCYVDETFLDLLTLTRHDAGFPMRVSSGFRHSTHPIEAAKALPGAHFLGKAADIDLDDMHGGGIWELVYAAKRRFTGVGIRADRTGKPRLLHLDNVQPGELHFYRPALWTYP